MTGGIKMLLNLEKTFEGLPQECFYQHEITKETILIKRGVKGFFPQGELKNRDPKELNEVLFPGVTENQLKAMYAGAMFGWDAPASNPYNYDKNGRFKTCLLPLEKG